MTEEQQQQTEEQQEQQAPEEGEILGEVIVGIDSVQGLYLKTPEGVPELNYVQIENMLNDMAKILFEKRVQHSVLEAFKKKFE